LATLRAGRSDQALGMAEAALADGVEHPLPLRLVALARQQAHRWDEAIALHRRSVRAAPGDVTSLALLAACLLEVGQPHAALAVWDQAQKAAPNDIAVLCGKADVLQNMNRHQDARALFEKTLMIDPDHFQAGYGLAQIALETGDIGAAARYAGHLTIRYPRSSAVGWLNGRIAIALCDYETGAAALRPILADPGLVPDQRAESLLLYGEALDGLARADDAFAAAAEGKGLQKKIFAERAASREGEVDKLNRLAAWFAAADPAPWRLAAEPDRRPGEPQTHVFLVGFPRSGTTLLEQVLAGNPEVTALEEAPTLAEHYAQFMTGPDDLLRLAHLSSADTAHWRAAYWRAVEAAGAGPLGRVFVDKAPAGTLYLPLIAKLFPSAKVLFAIRDPRDVALSCFRNNFQLNAMTYAFTDLAQTAACYDACMRLAKVYRAMLPLDLHEVRHEDFVRNFDAELKTLAQFLELEVTPGMADIGATAAGRVIRTPSARQVRMGLNSGGIGRWRGYAASLAPILPALASWAAHFGYPAD
jgi:tetratricopeptide (TPR) repeat protein